MIRIRNLFDTIIVLSINIKFITSAARRWKTVPATLSTAAKEHDKLQLFWRKLNNNGGAAYR